ncbi:MAG: hypothetical protein J5I65_18060 [Aridibacter famidurans]|nr:hypothetical protein [Aridibacter famidurans]
MFSQDTEANADKILKGNGRVNPSTLAMEIDLPLGKYPGRGINVPISISYSSKVWRMLSSTSTTYDQSPCHTESTPKFADDSAAVNKHEKLTR